jgi:hypothetical protein
VCLYIYIYIVPWVLNNTQHPGPSTAPPRPAVPSCAVGAGFLVGPSLSVLPPSHILFSLAPTSAGVGSPESVAAPPSPIHRAAAAAPYSPSFCRCHPLCCARFLLRHLGSGVERTGAQLLPSTSGSSSSTQSTPVR